jgi:hypothetical protein
MVINDYAVRGKGEKMAVFKAECANVLISQCSNGQTLRLDAAKLAVSRYRFFISTPACRQAGYHISKLTNGFHWSSND